MPRENSHNSVKKRNNWDETNMKRAIEAVKNNEMGYLKAAKVFDVPKSTLFRFITQGVDSSQSGLRRKLGKKPILSLELENKLVKYVLEMEPIFHGITKGDLRSMAYQLVTQNGLKNPFHDGKAGREWLHKFLNRHKDELYGRKPTETSCIWAAGFTKENVNAFFDLLEKAFDEYDYPRDRVYTVDETGLLIVQRKIPRIVGLKGLRQTGGLTSAERDAFVTIISCMSAAGHYVPPMMIFPQTKISHELMKGAPTGAIGVCHPSGWIEINIFTQWFRHFLQQTKPSANSPVLLLLDGHYSHTKSIEVIDLARENHVRIICFPPRCTDKLQPLHKTFMEELKSRYGEQVCLFLNHNKRPVSSCDIAELFAKAYLKVQTREIAEKGFEKTGIFPVDRFVLSDFLAVEESGEKKKCANNFLYCMSCMPEKNKTEEENIDENRSDTSESDVAEPLFINLQGEPSEDKPCTSSAIINTEENERKRERKIGETCLDSENELTNESDVNIFESDYTCDTNEELMHNNSENQNAECIFCLGKYSENQKREEWVRCTQCELWAHRACAGADKSVYTCDFCETLIQGDNTAGFSIFWADDGLDTGPILLQKSCKVEANDTVDSLYNNFLYPEGIKAMGEAVDLVAKGTAPMVPQPAEGATYDPLLNKKELQKIDWTKPAKEIHDFIRGLDSTPGALTMLDGEEVRLFGSSLSNDKPEVKKIVKEVRLFGSSVSNDKQPEVKKIVERKGIVHQGGLLIEAVDGRFVNVERIKIGTKTILASKYGQTDDSKVVEFTEEELKTADGLRRIWADILKIDVNDDTDFFASGGGSMDVVRLVEEVKDIYGVSLQNSDVFMASVFKEFTATVVLTARGNLAAKEIKYDAVEVQANNMTLRFPRQLFIDGQFVNGHGNPVDTINPHDESVICSVESANAEDVDLAVRAAKKAFEEGEWGKISARERGALLFRLADLMEEHKEELATLETLDSGAVYTLALKTHIGMSIETWRYFAGWCDKIHGSTIPISHARPNRNLTFTRREPIGVCGLVTPWNYPLMMLSWKMAVCLAAGNTVVMKPAQASPLTALKFAELSARAGIPPGVINIVCGFGSAVGNAIVEHPLIRKLGFTGSTQVGQAIMRCCAESNLKKVSLELGGKSPLVIFEDADMQQAVRIGMGSVFFNKGENCIAAGRLFVEETIHDEFVRRVVDEVKKITIGNPLDRSTAHGPQNHKAHLDKLLQFVQKGVKEGAKLVYGGKRLNRPGWYFEPTVFTDVEDDMYIAKEESFGPVMVISKFSSKNVDQMIARANNTEFGLASGVLTKDISRALRFAEKIEAGTVFINTYNKTDVAAPFGGFKMSGFGKDLGQEALNEYLKTKTVTIEY